MPEYSVYSEATRAGVSFRVVKPGSRYPWRRRPVATIAALSQDSAITALSRMLQAGLDESVAALERKSRWVEKQLAGGINVPLLELRSVATVSLLIAQAARWRTESRGTHFMAEHPREDAAFLTHNRLQPS